VISSASRQSASIREPLLAPRAETAEFACAGRQHDVVEVRAEAGHTAVEIRSSRPLRAAVTVSGSPS